MLITISTTEILINFLSYFHYILYFQMDFRKKVLYTYRLKLNFFLYSKNVKYEFVVYQLNPHPFLIKTKKKFFNIISMHWYFFDLKKSESFKNLFCRMIFFTSAKCITLKTFKIWIRNYMFLRIHYVIYSLYF